MTRTIRIYLGDGLTVRRARVVRRYRGLVVIRSADPDLPGFEIIHINTGLAIPHLKGLGRASALEICRVLATSLAWGSMWDTAFWDNLPRTHQDDLYGCIHALLSMLGDGGP